MTRLGGWIQTHGLAVAALVLGVIVAYLPVWHAGFLWDDDAHLTLNPCIIGPLGLREIWTTSAANYFPLVSTHLWVLHAIWGLNPLPYHLVNVVLHAASAVLLWRVLARLGVRGAWIGAALWALHPVQVESVAWISELKNTQAGLLYLLAIWFFVEWMLDERPAAEKTSRYALAWLCALLAILSKPSTVMMPVVLGLCWWWLKREWRWRDARWLVPFFAISAAASGWTIWEQRIHSLAQGPEWSQTWAERLIISGQVVWFYLGKLLWPHPLMFVYPRWAPDAAEVFAYLPALAVAVGLFGVWRYRSAGSRPLFFVFAYFVVSLFPVLGFFDVYYFRYSFVADHFQHLASIGPLALAGAGLATAANRFKSRGWLQPMFAASCGVLLLGLGGLTWRQSRAYVDNTTLWQTTAARNPQCWLAFNELGMASMGQGRYVEALGIFKRAFRIKPDDHAVLTNVGNALVQTGRPAEAVPYYERAVRAKPNLAAAHNGLGYALSLSNRPAEAIAEFNETLRLDPNLWQPHFSLANALVATGRLAEAITHYEAAAQLNPDSVSAHFSLGRALLQTGQHARAVPEFEAVLHLKPDHIEARADLAGALYLSGRPGEAVAQYETELRAKPDDPLAHNNLASALAQIGRTSEAIAHYEHALRLKPDYANAHCNFALLLEKLGQDAEAMRHLEAALRLKPDHEEARRNLDRLRAKQAGVSK